jgi:hypothetical protein
VTAIEVGLADRIELEYAEVVPGRPNKAFAEAYNPLRKIPGLLTDQGAVIHDSTVIYEYLDAQGGGCTVIPKAPEDRWRVLTNHALAQGLAGPLTARQRLVCSTVPAELVHGDEPSPAARAVMMPLGGTMAASRATPARARRRTPPPEKNRTLVRGPLLAGAVYASKTHA